MKNEKHYLFGFPYSKEEFSYYENKKFQKIENSKSFRFAVKIFYGLLISLLGGVIYLSFILDIPAIQIYNF